MALSCAPRLTGGGGGGRAGGTAGAGVPKLVSRGRLGALDVAKWRLANGLEVVLAPDPGARSVSYMTWFRVGSRHEDAAAGETGLAHLFEHLMFTQTRSAREPGDFDRRLEEVGANVNAMTYYDFTAYVDELPPDALALAVALEADRMVNLALTPKQVETEREVVAEERLASVEDSVDGLLDEMMYAQAFKRHPYRFPVIGLMKDIKAATAARALRFYRAHYAPNNAVIVAAGRFDPQALLGLVAAHYGGLPAAAVPPDRIRPERAPAAEVRAEIVRPVPADRFVLGYPAPPLGHADRAAFEVIDELLAGGPSSRLYRRLVVEAAIASSVSGDVPATRDPALYALWVQMVRGRGAAEGLAIIDAEIARLVDRPVPAADLVKAKNRLEADLWRRLLSSEGKAEELGQFEVVAGDWRQLTARAGEYAAVTAGDVQRVAAASLAPRARSVVIARPKP